LLTFAQNVVVSFDAGLLHDSEMKIRDAIAEDAPAACQVLRRSISKLCVADLENDPTILAKWLLNKTPDIVASWMALPDSSLLVAVEHGTILAVGGVTMAGHITLNYVSPDARFRGVSRALLAALEARAIERGNTRCTLNSTETAREFYLANGYLIDGPPDHKHGTGGYPMSKLLAPIGPIG
jgi:GNAT superfamily N-acetyltransferase